MATILCATRGGEASYRTQDHVIKLAKERGDDLVFLYVTDVQFLKTMAGPIVVDVETEIENLAEFLLLMAQERAAKAGVTATTLVKRGVFRAALIEAAQEVGATLVVLGSPGESNITALAQLEEVAAAVQEATDAATLIV